MLNVDPFLIKILSYICNLLNIVCWLGVLIPQLYKNYKLKSSDAISYFLVYNWIIAGSLSLLSAIQKNASITLIVIMIPHIIMDVIFLAQLLYYRKNPKFNKIEFVYTLTSSLFVLFLFIISNIVYNLLLINIIAYISQILFVLCKLPQIYLNYNRKNIYGLSKLAFFNIFLSNMFFVFSFLLILIISENYTEYIFNNIQWIIGFICGCILDIVLLFQFYIYENNEYTILI